MMYVEKDKLKEKFGEPEAGFALGSLYIWLSIVSGGASLIFGIVGLATDSVPGNLNDCLFGIVMAGSAFLLKRRRGMFTSSFLPL